MLSGSRRDNIAGKPRPDLPRKHTNTTRQLPPDLRPKGEPRLPCFGKSAGKLKIGRLSSKKSARNGVATRQVKNRKAATGGPRTGPAGRLEYGPETYFARNWSM